MGEELVKRGMCRERNWLGEKYVRSGISQKENVSERNKSEEECVGSGIS